MGSGSFTLRGFADYSAKAGKLYSADTKRVTGQVYKETSLHNSLNPRNILRECVNSKEHPNTLPVILGLDVTGSMGSACKETAEALGVIVSDLFEKYNKQGIDIEFCMMGIGDLDYDDAPIQMGQFESDVRIAKDLDHIFMEHGGGSNPFESYTAAWYMGLNHTKLDCFDQNGRKGIIITMGDEPLNPYLPKEELERVTGDTLQEDIDTDKLYTEAKKKFDIYHISVDHRTVNDREKTSWSQFLGENYHISTVNGLADTIKKCIDKSIANTVDADAIVSIDTGSAEESETPVITW